MESWFLVNAWQCKTLPWFSSCTCVHSWQIIFWHLTTKLSFKLKPQLGIRVIFPASRIANSANTHCMHRLKGFLDFFFKMQKNKSHHKLLEQYTRFLSRKKTAVHPWVTSLREAAREYPLYIYSNRKDFLLKRIRGNRYKTLYGPTEWRRILVIVLTCRTIAIALKNAQKLSRKTRVIRTKESINPRLFTASSLLQNQ